MIEFNYWSNTYFGDSESVSVKSQSNIIRYNTVNNNPGASFVFRNGDYNVAYSNFLLNDGGGFRVKQANNIWIYNNYISGTVTINPMAIE